MRRRPEPLIAKPEDVADRVDKPNGKTAVTGNTVVALENTLCGHVWRCTGQSNIPGVLEASPRP